MEVMTRTLWYRISTASYLNRHSFLFAIITWVRIENYCTLFGPTDARGLKSADIPVGASKSGTNRMSYFRRA